MKEEWIEGYSKCIDDIGSAANITGFVPTPTSRADVDKNRRFLCHLLEIPYTTSPRRILELLGESVYGRWAISEAGVNS